MRGPNKKPAAFLTPALTLAGLVASSAAAAPIDRANLIYNRLNGTPPPAATLADLTTKVEGGNIQGAALDAINDPSGNFYNVLLRSVVSQWTNTSGSPRVDLNDMTATIIGMVRDDVPFNTALSADLVYTADPAKLSGVPAYSLANNDHYAFIDTAGASLKDVLAPQKQSALSPTLPKAATAGVMTTRGFAEAFFKDGTNRRAVSFTLQNFLCSTMNQLADTTRPDVRVRRDVSRDPGGDSTLYRNRCAGCHAGMDALAGAFAYYDVEAGATPDADKFVYKPSNVSMKVNRNADQFPAGYGTTDDSFINQWTAGQNAALGWSGPTTGHGAKEFGTMLTSSTQFSTCMATQAMTAVCLHAPTTATETSAVTAIAADFQKTGNLKTAFATAAVACSGE